MTSRCETVAVVFQNCVSTSMDHLTLQYIFSSSDLFNISPAVSFLSHLGLCTQAVFVLLLCLVC